MLVWDRMSKCYSLKKQKHFRLNRCVDTVAKILTTHFGMAAAFIFIGGFQQRTDNFCIVVRICGSLQDVKIFTNSFDNSIGIRWFKRLKRLQNLCLIFFRALPSLNCRKITRLPHVDFTFGSTMRTHMSWQLPNKRNYSF